MKTLIAKSHCAIFVSAGGSGKSTIYNNNKPSQHSCFRRQNIWCTFCHVKKNATSAKNFGTLLFNAVILVSGYLKQVKRLCPLAPRKCFRDETDNGLPWSITTRKQQNIQPSLKSKCPQARKMFEEAFGTIQVAMSIDQQDIGLGFCAPLWLTQIHAAQRDQ